MSNVWNHRRKAAFAKMHDGYGEVLHSNPKALFRRGLLTHGEYLLVTDPRTEPDATWAWPSGKFTKRQLHKAERRAWKTGRERSLSHWRSECNWKGW